MNYRDVYREGQHMLSENNISEAENDARLLLEYVCGTNRNTLLAHPDREVTALEQERYMLLMEKRAAHVPLQHLTNEQDFMGLTFFVDGRVLVPRQDTECLVEEAMIYIEDGMKVLDMCTGSGCILLSLMNYRDIEGVGCDLSEAALEVAEINAERLGLKPSLKKSDMFAALGKEYYGYFDAIVSNPPYIRNEIIKDLMPEVANHDPMMALDGGDDGLDFYRIIADEAKKYLTNYGRVFLEIGFDQKEDIIRLLEGSGYSDVKVIDDYASNPRVAVAKYIRK